MSKKKTGLLVAFGAIIGVAAAGLSYYLKYKSFSNDVDKDFHEYEDEEDDEDMNGEVSAVSSCESAGRTYITLNKSSEGTESSECTESSESTDSCDCGDSCECGESCDCNEAAPEESSEEPAMAPKTATATVKEETEGAGE